VVGGEWVGLSGRTMRPGSDQDPPRGGEGGGPGRDASEAGEDVGGEEVGDGGAQPLQRPLTLVLHEPLQPGPGAKGAEGA